jgi:DNA mismatch endonuclease (patch repair protein)
MSIMSNPPASPPPSSARAAAVMRGNRRAGTQPEQRLRSALHARGLRFRKDRLLRLGGEKARPDVVFTRARLAVFVDGCFWHGCPQHYVPSKSSRRYWSSKIERNRERDQRQTAALESFGWTVVRIWEHEQTEDATARVVAAHARLIAAI